MVKFQKSYIMSTKSTIIPTTSVAVGMTKSFLDCRCVIITKISIKIQFDEQMCSMPFCCLSYIFHANPYSSLWTNKFNFKIFLQRVLSHIIKGNVFTLDLSSSSSFEWIGSSSLGDFYAFIITPFNISIILTNKYS